MGKTLLILVITVVIFLGGFYMLFYNQEEKIIVNESPTVNENLDEEVDNEELVVTETDTEKVDTSTWLDYQNMTKKLVFTTKYPAEDWSVVEQKNDEEFNLIFTNGDSCQVLYTFDFVSQSYNFDLVNNLQQEKCALILQKIIAYASVPKFGTAASALYEEESEEQTTEEETTSDEETVITEESEESVDESENVNEEVVDEENIENENDEEMLDEEAEESEAEVVVQEPEEISEGITDQEILEMSAEDRYEMVKEFVHEYLTEYAKRHWDYVKSKLSQKALTELGDQNLIDIVNKYYYYEVLSFISPVSETQYTTTVKLTNKDEEPIGEGDGVYKLNIVWEHGEWKIDNYLFE